jgi:hypothetical protein
MALTKAHNRMIDGAAANVKDFGAVGDYNTTTQNGTDDTAAIQAAINSGAKTIFFPADFNFLIKTQVTISSDDITLTGYGSTVVTEDDIANQTGIFLISGDRCSVFGLSIEGQAGTAQAANCDGIFVDSGTNSTIQDCKIQNFDDGFGIGLRSLGSNHIVKDNYITACTPVTAGTQYGAIGANADGSLITGNRITGHNQTAVSAFGTDYLTITDNFMQGASGVSTVGGVIFDGLTIGGVIDGNTIYTGDVEGIQIAGNIATYGGASADHIISNNTIFNSDYSAITLYAADTGAVTRVTISGNHISNSSSTAGRAIEMNRVTKILITGNYILGHDKGVETPNLVTDCNISSNYFYNQQATAIQVHGSKWLVSSNKIVGDGTNTLGMTFNGVTIAGEQLIHGNQISDCATGIVGTFNSSLQTYVYNNHFVDNTTNYSWTGRGVNNVKDNGFDSATAGEFTLASGAATIIYSGLLADDKIALHIKTAGSGTEGAVYIKTKTAGSQFTVGSTSGTDNSVWYWEVIR